MNESADTTAVPITKAELRRAALQKRRAVHAARGQVAAVQLGTQIRHVISQPSDKTIAGYWPLGDEIDPRPTMEAFCKSGVRIALPVTGSRYDVLVFRVWEPGVVLETGPFGTMHPPQREQVVIPDIILVPMLAFDDVGHRLGYGAGYYDRTLATLRRDRNVMALGVGYDEQEVAHVPPDPHDQMLDGVITDRRALMFNRAVGA